MEAPGWLLACKVPSVAPVVTMLAVCGSLTCIQYAPTLLALW